MSDLGPAGHGNVRARLLFPWKLLQPRPCTKPDQGVELRSCLNSRSRKSASPWEDSGKIEVTWAKKKTPQCLSLHVKAKDLGLPPCEEAPMRHCQACGCRGSLSETGRENVSQLQIGFPNLIFASWWVQQGGRVQVSRPSPGKCNMDPPPRKRSPNPPPPPLKTPDPKPTSQTAGGMTPALASKTKPIQGCGTRCGRCHGRDGTSLKVQRRKSIWGPAESIHLVH